MKGRKATLFKFVYLSLLAKGFILIHFHASVNIVPLTFGNCGLFPKEKGYLMTLVIRGHVGSHFILWEPCTAQTHALLMGASRKKRNISPSKGKLPAVRLILCSSRAYWIQSWRQPLWRLQIKLMLVGRTSTKANVIPTSLSRLDCLRMFFRLVIWLGLPSCLPNSYAISFLPFSLGLMKYNLHRVKFTPYFRYTVCRVLKNVYIMYLHHT